MTKHVEYMRRYQDELTAFRRDLHAHPELGFEELRTSDRVAQKLTEWGIPVHRGLARTGLVGVIEGREPRRRAVALRADMDCLPIEEAAERPHRSTHAGRMHACGHDGHTTMLLGAARYLAETRAFAGTVNVIFQPAEEGRGGANVMVQEGLFERFPADDVYALHNAPRLAAGRIAVRAGAVLAATDGMRIVVSGRGGHAGMPNLAVDPVVLAAHIITALQMIASRNIKPTDALVVSVCSVQTSQVGAFNVIPESVTLLGTVRTLDPAIRDLAGTRIREIASGVAASLGGRAEVELVRGTPVTINGAREAALAATVGERVFGASNVERALEPSMGGEDFAYMLEQRPGALVLIGQGSHEHACDLHTPSYDFNDDILALGAGYLAALAEHALSSDRSEIHVDHHV